MQETPQESCSESLEQALRNLVAMTADLVHGKFREGRQPGDIA